MNGSAIFLVILEIVFVSSAYGQCKYDWKQIYDHDGITVFSRKVPGATLLAFKGVTTVNCSPAKVFKVLKDVSRRKEWMPRLLEARIIQQVSEIEHIEYQRIDAPWPCRDRDLLFRGGAEFHKREKNVFVWLKSIKHPKVSERKGVVRAEILRGSYSIEALEDNDKTMLTLEIHIDLKGWMPTWIANWVQKNWSRDFLEGLRSQAKKNDIFPDDRTMEFFKTGELCLENNS